MLLVSVWSGWLVTIWDSIRANRDTTWPASEPVTSSSDRSLPVGKESKGRPPRAVNVNREYLTQNRFTTSSINFLINSVEPHSCEDEVFRWNLWAPEPVGQLRLKIHENELSFVGINCFFSGYLERKKNHANFKSLSWRWHWITDVVLFFF